jgi:hypothetical protein
MPTTLYRDTGYTLNHLIEDIRKGRIGLPDIQRPFVWSSTRVRDLFDSMYRGYPIGTLMFWETGADVGTRRIGSDATDTVPQVLVVDGQQRLTSLYAVLTGEKVLDKSFDFRRIRIAFRPTTEIFEVTDAAIERDPEFIADITALWSSGYRSEARRYLDRLAASRETTLSEDYRDLLEERIDRVRDLRDFRFQVIELGAGASEDEVADIFVRINSEGVQLKQADFILTLMSVHWEKGRRQLEEFSRNAVDPTVVGASPKNPFITPSPDQLLRVAVAVAFRRARLQFVYSILRGKDLATGEVSSARRDEQFGILDTAQDRVLDLTNWHEFLKCLAAAGFRSRSMITSNNALLFSYAMWLIGRKDFGLDTATIRPVIARWFFMSHTTGRYTSSPESQLEADLGRISELPPGKGDAFIAELDRIVRANFTTDYWEITLPNKLDTSSPRSPALFAYLAALNVLDAQVLFSEMRMRDLLDPSVTAPRSVERHHLFPKGYLKRIGVTNSRQVNAIANMAFLDWPENAKIRDAAPTDYWPTMADRAKPDELKRQVHLHALPVGWEQLDYPTFLERRRALIARVVREGFESMWDHGRKVTTTSLADFLAEGESQTTEFKSSARWNLHTHDRDPRLEHVIVKTICGFLNAEGGTLLIGVDDSGQILGLADDLKTLGRKADADGYELFLRQLIDTHLTMATAGLVRIKFTQVDDALVCIVAVAAAARPVFSKPAKGGGIETSEFWVRVGNATKQLHGDDMVEFQKRQWG